MWDVILPMFFLALIAYGFVRLLAFIIPRERGASKHRRKHKKRKADPETDATFFNIIGPLTGTHISDWFKK